MGIPHHAKNCKRIITAVFFIFIFIFTANTAAAYNSVFVVDNVKVDVTAENSVAAQEQAFDQAQVKAFRVLAQRLVDEAQAKVMEMPDALTISSFIKDYEITNEQLSPVRYVGTYTFRFREKEVSSFFSLSGVYFTATPSKSLLVLPVFQKDGKNAIWSQDNLWMQAWSIANLPTGLVPVEVPIGDLMDVADINDDNALSYDRRSLDRMLGRYDADEAAVMIAVPDITLLSVASESDTAKGRLRISIYRTDRAQAEHVKDIYIDANGEETREELYARAVQSAHGALQKDWKRRTVSSAAQMREYYVRAQFKTLKQWVSIQKSLRGLPGIDDITLRSIKRNEAHLSFSFRGDEERLSYSLRDAALKLSAPYQNSAAQSYTTVGRDAPDVVYDLVLGRNNDAPKTPSGFYQGRSVPEIEPAAGSKPDMRNTSHTF